VVVGVGLCLCWFMVWLVVLGGVECVNCLWNGIVVCLLVFFVFGFLLVL